MRDRPLFENELSGIRGLFRREPAVAKAVALLVALVAMVASFQVGFVAGMDQGKHITIRVGDGYVAGEGTGTAT